MARRRRALGRDRGPGRGPVRPAAADSVGTREAAAALVAGAASGGLHPQPRAGAKDLTWGAEEAGAACLPLPTNGEAAAAEGVPWEGSFHGRRSAVEAARSRSLDLG